MLKYLINLIFPPKCIFCNNILELNSDIYICKECFKNIPFIDSIQILRGTSDYYDDIVCICEYSGIIRDALVKFKFFNKPSYYKTFAKMLAIKIKETNWQEIDIIVGIPLYFEKEQKRGYNQSYLISKALSKELGVAEGTSFVTRVRDTGSQSLLAKNQRISNIKDAFKVNVINGVNGKTILLIDDILTTGSTINECSKALKQAGARKVIAAVVATGRKF